ncbi:DUF4173 domain-containing protein [Ascidiaceihabitans sp.]|uniref:DUF4153 domain-containing protein n=1 Tax=Ascidiaceihabitans sp. TaxID=1872644 RepID=UPI0032986A60
MKSFAIRGVPHTMQQDGWWLSSGPKEQKTDGAIINNAKFGGWSRLLLLLVLIALGDMLFWKVTPGVSLAAFAVILVLAALSLIQPALSKRRLAIIGMGTVLAVLPVIELVQPLSVLILVVGVSAVLSIAAGVPWHRVQTATLRFWVVGFGQTTRDVSRGAARVSAPKWSTTRARAFAIGWALPIGFGLLFLVLFARANPLLSDVIEALVPNRLPDLDVWRWALWLIVGGIAWPCLILWRLKEQLRRDGPANIALPTSKLINGQAVLRSLLIFNLMFAVQTVTDVVVLAGGALPEGMSYATYAHRGAYPLLITALLAGIFTMIARPFAKDIPLVRVLLLVWTLQTLALVLGSAVRLDAYVDVYGLTRLRLAAAVWMALVAAGLCVVWVQVWRDEVAAWMLVRVGVLGICVLYGASLVSFDRVIATHNMIHDVKLDDFYLCTLSEAAAPVIARYVLRQRMDPCPDMVMSAMRVAQPRDIREWGFRNWRVRRSLAANAPEGLLQ